MAFVSLSRFGAAGSNMARILLVEDDKLLAAGLVALLKRDGHAVDWVNNAEEALEIERTETYGLIIMDVGLPGMSGFDAVRAARTSGRDAPILILTARHDRPDRIKGLDLGADDYLGKPFDPEELLAHVRALVRRSAGSRSSVVTVGNLTCDSASSQAELAGKALNLPRREWAVLWALASRAGKVVPKERLISEVFDYDDPVGTNAVEVYITRLRKKIAPDGPTIRSLRGLGYIMDGAP